MDVELVTYDSDQDFRNLKEEWTRLHTEAESKSLFVTWEWLYAWWHVVQPAVELKLLAVTYHGRLVALAPLVRRWTLYYGVPLTEVCFLGDPVSDRQYFLVARGAENTLARLWSHLLRNPYQATLLRLDQVPSESCTIRSIPVASHVHVEPCSTLPYVSMSGDWASYEKTLTGKFRNEMRTRPKVFATFGDWEVQFITGTDVLPHLEQVADVERNSTKARTAAAFLADPRHLQFIRTFAALAVPPHIELVLSLLRIGNQIAAYALGFLFDGVYHGYNTADLDKYRRGTPGKFVIHETLRFAFGIGAREFDFLRGGSAAKKEWSHRTRTNQRVVWLAPGLRGTVIRWAVLGARPWLLSIARRLRS